MKVVEDLSRMMTMMLMMMIMMTTILTISVNNDVMIRGEEAKRND